MTGQWRGRDSILKLQHREAPPGGGFAGRALRLPRAHATLSPGQRCFVICSGAVSSPRPSYRGTSAAACLRVGGGGFFKIPFAGRREFGDQTTRDDADAFHSSRMESRHGKVRVKSYPSSGF
jgi:hypothetical protein